MGYMGWNGMERDGMGVVEREWDGIKKKVLSCTFLKVLLIIFWWREFSFL